jgi:8-oxo-dGTP pyrophosphatase MutT (NUDIX family)
MPPAARGAAVAPHALALPALRARFSAPPVWEPEMRADARWLATDQPPRAAAVLIALVQRADGVHVVLTRRTAHLADHAGQISFPGGRVDAADAADPVAAALREAHEEVGLPPRGVEVLGTLPQYLTATHYLVTPVVGWVPSFDRPRLDAFEVAEVFEVPLGFLMDPRHHERRAVELDGQVRRFYAMPWTAAAGARYFIWGATAAMLRNLYHFLRA